METKQLDNNNNESVTDNVAIDVMKHLNEMQTEDRKKAKKKKKETRKQKEKREAKAFEASLRGMKKEEIIAANKAKVAKYHPEPDFDRYSSAIYQSRKKIEFEKEMKEKNKNRWVSIVSVPMGGRNKR